jgi:hypothetical protein
MDTVRPAWHGRFQIARLELSTVELRPGHDDCHADRVEQIMVDELFARRQRARSMLPAEDGLSVNAWLKLTCYEIILAWLTVDEGEELLERLDRHKRFVRGSRKEGRDVFQEGIVAIFARSAKAVTVRDRERLAAPMWHGFRHYIPPALLDGFNRQYPAHTANDVRWRKRIEPALEDWVVEQRIYSRLQECSLDAFRATYPSQIEDRIASAFERLQGESHW